MELGQKHGHFDFKTELFGSFYFNTDFFSHGDDEKTQT